MKLSIIIPVFNEEKTISEILKKVLAVKLPSLEKEIIVVDDGSTDNTKQVLSKFQIVRKSEFSNEKPNFKFQIFRHDRNQGKGFAIRTGLKYVTGDIILIQDADLEYDPSYYPILLKPILKKSAKVVYGSRLINYPLKFWGKDKTVLPTHLIANRFLTGLTNLLYGSKLTDMETCYKIFQRVCLNGIILESNGFEFEPEITAKLLKKGHKIFEVSINVKPRTYQEGKKINLWDGIKAVWTILKYRFVD